MTMCIIRQVLDNGCLLECDEAHILLQDRSSILSEMVRMTKDHEHDLRKSAEKVGWFLLIYSSIEGFIGTIQSGEKNNAKII